jgi:hypothetical protein
MTRSIPARRLALARIAAGLAAARLGDSHALDAPAGKVILTITGALTHTNDGSAAVFDLELLRRLPQHSFSTRTPWFPQPRKFSGVLVRELLAAVGAQGSTLRALALNDYRVDIPADDLTDHGALLAYLLDDQPMPVREKGPLVIIYPFDDHPELRSAVRFSRAIWQLHSIEVK